jgi:hypothetical protein
MICHNDRQKAGQLSLEHVDPANVASNPDVFEKVIRKLRAGLMPPAGLSRPAKAVLDGVVSQLETDLDRVAAVDPNPGRTAPFHRLNRAEYKNAVRDLLLVHVDVDATLPADDASYGFDNIGGVLKISQAALEQYLSAAQKISRAAAGGAPFGAEAEEFRAPETLNQYNHIDGLPFGTRGGILAKYTFPRDGEYEIAVDLLCRVAGECDGSTGFVDEHVLEVLIDGETVTRFTLEPRTAPRPTEGRTWRVRVPVRAGEREVAATFRRVPPIAEVDSNFKRFDRPFYLNGLIGVANQTIYQPFVDRLTVAGPLGVPGGPGDTPSRRRVFLCSPSSAVQERPCARHILTMLARRAYRRAVTGDDIKVLIEFYDRGRANGGFEEGVETAIRRILISPEFLFRVERDPAGIQPGANYPISDLELASRLSFFLWSSIPDEELLDLAITRRLKEPGVVEGQVRRMLSDPRADALVANFAGQWLLLRNLQTVQPDVPTFPNFDDSLRQAFRRETELFVGTILRENRGVMEMLTADFTFVNERLARHYGMRGIYGDQFRRVKVTDPNRRGLLGQGSILTVTSRPNRTSPVLRGKWILSTLLGTPPPDPPANVPALDEKPTANHATTATVRERMARHRANPVCAGCHSMIDPLGFALENFDAVGRWRVVDDRFAPIDASGVLPDGTKFAGLADFRAALVTEPKRFATTVTEKLMVYAVGRGVEAYDRPAIRAIVRSAAPRGYVLSDLIAGIVRSVPFQMRRAGTAVVENEASR